MAEVENKAEEHSGVAQAAQTDKPVYGLLITTDVKYKFIYDVDFELPNCDKLATVPKKSGKAKRFQVWYDAECLSKEVGFNDLAAEVLNHLGFNLNRLPGRLVRGPILIGLEYGEKQPTAFTAEDMATLKALCDKFQQEEVD